MSSFSRRLHHRQDLADRLNSIIISRRSIVGARASRILFSRAVMSNPGWPNSIRSVSITWGTWAGYCRRLRIDFQTCLFKHRCSLIRFPALLSPQFSVVMSHWHEVRKITRHYTMSCIFCRSRSVHCCFEVTSKFVLHHISVRCSRGLPSKVCLGHVVYWRCYLSKSLAVLLRGRWWSILNSERGRIRKTSALHRYTNVVFHDVAWRVVLEAKILMA